jgi:anti-anti-sigma factor
MATSSGLRVLEDGAVTTIQFCEHQILDEVRIGEMQSEMIALLDAKTRPLIVIDFHNVDYMGSACLGMLVAANTRVNQRQGQLRLANIQPKLLRILQLTKLDSVLKFSWTQSGADGVLNPLAQEKALGLP